MALKRWEALNPDTLAYHVMFADSQILPAGLQQVSAFIQGA